MNLTQLLENLSAKNVELWVDGDKLRYRSPEKVLTPELLGEIKQHKPEIIRILSSDTDDATTYPLSHGQKALWFLYQLAPDSIAYNTTYAAKLVTNLDIAALKQAAQSLIERHPILRTTFTTLDGEPVQTVHENQQVCFNVQEAFNWNQDDVDNWLSETSDRPFDLLEGPILRFNLLVNHSIEGTGNKKVSRNTTTDTLTTKEYILLINVHHIVVDFWSLEIIISELRSLYAAITTGVEPSLPRQNYQYRDYLKWSEQMLAGSEGEGLYNYWQQQLSGDLPVLDLPTDKPRPEIQTFNGACKFFALEDKLLQKLTELARGEGVSLYTVIFTALQILLFRYSSQEDILIGSPMVNRSRSEFEKIVGYFTNPVVLRTDLSGNPSFEELLGRSRSCVLNALDHQEYPFPLLVEQLQPVRDPSYSPLYQVMLAWDSSYPSEGKVSIAESDGLIVESMIPGAKGAGFDLTLTILDVPGALKGTWNYNTDLFEASTIERMTGHFVTLLEGIVANPQQHISQFPLLTEAEKQRLLVEWNHTEREYPQEKSIHRLFEEQVERTPDTVAVVFEDVETRHVASATYHELNCRGNQLAHYLKSRGVGADVVVGICAERSVEMVVGILGILKAGGAYVPMDPEYPQDRLSFMLEDSGVSVLLTQETLLERLPEHKACVVCLDTNWQVISQESRENVISGVQGNNLGYVIYTSGSTGKPKGVAMNQLPLCNLILWQLENMTVSSGAKTLQFAPISFDVSFQEIFSTWCSGGTLVLINEELRRDAVALLGVLEEKAVERLFLPFVALQQLAEVAISTGSIPSHLREIITAGEQLQITPAISKCLSKLTDCTLHNHYGPSESHVVTSYTLTNTVENWPSLPPIGRPIANTKIYILDGKLQPVPIGVSGELYIGGNALARGYFNRPELTQEKFIANPFTRSSGETDGKCERIYKTGDLARYLPDGNIEYLGRIDNQVKIRGFRIELGEIETTLTQHPHVQASVVIAREDIPGDKRLVAYIAPHQEQKPTIDELRQFIKAKMPEYMVPNAFVILEFLPLTPSGKVNRRALPLPVTQLTSATDKIVKPRNPIEEILASIWAEVLKVEQVGINDNFFELGGHSLLATQLISRIRNSFKLEMPLQSLFTAPTVAELAENIQQLQQQNLELTTPPIVATSRQGELPLSFAQTRLWFLDRLEPDNAFYNLPVALRLLGNLNRDALEQSLAEIINRHEILRTNFIVVDGQPTQIIHPTTPWKLTVADWQSKLCQQEISPEQFINKESQQPFDLSTESLIKTTLLVHSETEHILLVCMHHIVSDGWSMGVFVEELTALYNAYAQGEPTPLGLMPLQYADFAQWQREWLQGEVLQTQLNYWQQQLADAPAFLPLPTDKPRPAVQTFHGAHHPFTLSQELTDRLTQLSQQQGVTLFMTLLAVFDILLYRYTGAKDILVGTPIANRNRREIEGLIGFFVNALVMRTDLSGNPSFSELLPRVREMALGAYAHQDLPFEMLVEALQPERYLGHTPLFQVMFMLQNNPISPMELAGLSVNRLEVESITAKFDLTLSMENTANGLVGIWEYNTDLFNSSTIERITGHFVTMLEAIVANPQQGIAQLPLLKQSEQQQLLVDWNQTQIEYPRKCIHQLFEEQVEKTPNAVAVVFQNQHLTYEQLNSRANQLADYLCSEGVEAESLVGICLERSLEMVVGILAILKAGGAYVPMDPEYPQERISFMLEDTSVKVLLTQEKLVESVGKYQGHIICLDSQWQGENQWSEKNPITDVQPNNLAYVIYTSGTTGKPKGVMVTHSSLCNHMLWMQTTFSLSAQDKVLQKTPFGFDASVWEFYAPLLVGGQLIMAESGGHKDADYLINLINQRQVTTIQLVPSLLQMLLEAPGIENCHSLKQVFCGGEALQVALIENLSSKLDCRLYNLYGPSEACIDATFWDCNHHRHGQIVPIGRAIANAQIYILDQFCQPVPIGVPGELHIGGAGLARGYLNQAELTNEKFISNPFDNDSDSRLYKTGDLARYLPDGNIEYLGRIDNQVKLRGFRIELGEIETVLSSNANVKSSVVIVREDIPGDKRLVAYIVPQKQVTPTISELRSFLKAKLPEYMVPNAFVILESLPLTKNGKVDRRALPEPELRSGIEVNLVAPRTFIEEILANIWAEVLRLEQVGIHDNFFELGGDSILSIQIISKASAAGVQLTFKQLFANQTIAELAAVATTTKALQIEQGLVTGDVPLTPIQQWFFEQELPQPHHYNQSFLLSLPANIKPELLKQAWQQLLVHHDALRLRFIQTDEHWQQIHDAPSDKKDFSIFDLSTLSQSQQKNTIEATANQLQASLNLAENLVEVAFFNLGVDKRTRLLIIIHHLVVDGVSWRILLEDLQTAYEQLTQGKTIQLPAKTTSFKDWSLSLREYAQSSEALKSELADWLRVSEASVAPIGVDYQGGANTWESANTISVSLNETQTQALLQDVPKAYKTQINDVLITALVLVLSRWTNQTEVLFNLEGHGREDIIDNVDLSRTIGWFTTIFPVVVKLGITNNLGNVLKSVKEQLREIPNKGIGYGLLRYMNQQPEIANQLQKLPTSEISFNYLGQFSQLLNADGVFKLASESSGQSYSNIGKRPYLIDINAIITNEQLKIDWTYSGNIHHHETIENIAQEFVTTLQELINHCLSPENGGYTPTDFPLAKLNQLQLDRVLAGLALKSELDKTNWQNVEDIYPLSPMQKGMLFHSLYAPDEGIYFEQVSCTLKGKLNVPAFEQAWQQVVANHSVFRTAFIWESLSQPLQVVYREVDVTVKSYDWRELSAPEQQQQLKELLDSERRIGLSLSLAPLMRLHLIQLGDNTYEFVWSHHHLLLDGWSLPLVFKDLLDFYQGCVREDFLPLKPTLNYRNYIAWLEQQDFIQAEKFWQELLKGFSAPTPLTVDKLLLSQDSHSLGYKEQQIELTPAATTAVQSFVRQHQLTVNNLMQATWALLLSRYSQQTDVVFGATVSGRPTALEGVESMVGLFINTLPVRVQISGETELLELLKDLQGQLVESEQFSYSSLVDIQGFSDVPRGTSLFETIVVFENYPVDRSILQDNHNFSISNVRGIEQTNYPLTVAIVPGEQLLVKISYDTTRFDSPTIERMLGHFVTMLEAIVANPQQGIAQLPLLTESEQQQLLVEWNQTQIEYPRKCIHQLFEEQVERTPNNVAVVYENQQFTYQELNSKANQLAHYLRSKGVGAEVKVGICVERSPLMVVGILGILKAGGAYVPMDPEYPQERISFMLEDTQVSVLLTQKKLVESVGKYQGHVICLDSQWQGENQWSEKNPITDVQPNNLAYVIYTSGTTGKPKGVMVTHSSLCNHMLWMQTTFSLSAQDKVLQKTPFGFDASVWEFYAPLLVGGQLIMAESGGHKDADYLINLINQQQVTTIQLVPSLLQMLLEAPGIENCHSLKQVFCGGEALVSLSIENLFSKLDCKLYNLYGPSEACIDATFWDCNHHRHGQIVPIGKAIANAQIYILDQFCQPVPIGVPGELHIGGAGLARGYLNQAELTNEKFISNPFDNDSDSRLYKTGDLARYLPDGNIEYLGRIDNQVKLRGFRIELGEIETVLSSYIHVQTSVVIVREDIPGDKRLVAYIVPQKQVTPTISELRQYLKAKLPEYMVPNAFVILESLPLTKNGKVDRRALPEPELRSGVEVNLVAPSNPIEEILATIWTEVLRLEEVGIYDNFFELGGDSILSIQIITRASVAGVQVTLKQLFAHPTIAELAAVAGTTKALQIEQGLVTGDVPLTPIQQWFFEQELPQRHHYNQSFLLSLPANIKPELLKQAWQQLLIHHDALRLRFVQTDEHWQQMHESPNETCVETLHCNVSKSKFIPGFSNADFYIFDLSRLSQSEQKTAIENLGTQLQASLNLGENLAQVAFFWLGVDKGARLLISIHHLVVDGVSWRILLEDLQTAYEQLTQRKAIQLPAKTTSFKDWSISLREYAHTDALKSELTYWLSASGKSVAPIAVDYQGKANTWESATTLSVSLNETQTQELLQDVPKAYKTQINDVLVTALALVLSRWTNKTEVLFNLEGHGREDIIDNVDLSRTIGWFTTIFPVVLKLEAIDKDNLGNILKSVKEQLREIPNKGIGYGLLRYMNQQPEIANQLNKLPASEISFNYLGQFTSVLNTSSKMQLASESSGQSYSNTGQRPYLLDINAIITNQQLKIDWTYSSNFHRHETIENIAQEFVATLQELIAHCLSKESGGYTPTDFPLVELSQLELDQIFENL